MNKEQFGDWFSKVKMMDQLLRLVDVPEKASKISHQLQELTVLKREVNLSTNRHRVTLLEPKFRMINQTTNQVTSHHLFMHGKINQSVNLFMIFLQFLLNYQN